MIQVPIYNAAGAKVGEETVDPADFGGEVNKQLLHEVVLMHRANKRVGTVNTRGRADVMGSGKKLFRQKGTGNARAGGKRTNKRKGGGVAFARRNRDYSYALPKRAVRAAIRMAILSKFQDLQAVIVDGLFHESEKPKTKPIATALAAIARPDLKEHEATAESGETKAKARTRTLHDRTILLGIPAHNPALHQSARNIEGVTVAPVAEFDTYTVLQKRYLVLTREAFQALKERVKAKPARRDHTLAAAKAEAKAQAEAEAKTKPKVKSRRSTRPLVKTVPPIARSAKEKN
jgi:large subunit ribosomal protein L4